MTIAEPGPVSVQGAARSATDQACGTESLSVVDTTELRWFFPGPLPLEVRDWFHGSTGAPEERCDTYLLDGRHHIGTKRRFRETLELKVRQSVEEWIELGDGLAGAPETWRKWSPADGLVVDDADDRWVDVHKSIVKRWFAADGTELAFSSGPPVGGDGCDIEVAAVAVGAVRGWTIALAAFGAPARRRDCLRSSWGALPETAAPTKPFVSRTGRAMGYPEWLARTVSR